MPGLKPADQHPTRDMTTAPRLFQRSPIVRWAIAMGEPPLNTVDVKSSCDRRRSNTATPQSEPPNCGTVVQDSSLPTTWP